MDDTLQMLLNIQGKAPPPAAGDPPRGSPAPPPQPPPMAEYKKAFRLAYNYLEKHLPPQNTPEWWTAAAQEISATWNQGGRSPFLHSLLSAVYDELERTKPAQEAENGF